MKYCGHCGKPAYAQRKEPLSECCDADLYHDMALTKLWDEYDQELEQQLTEAEYRFEDKRDRELTEG